LEQTKSFRQDEGGITNGLEKSFGIIGSFQVFDQMFVMTQGGPVGSTETIVYYLIDRFQALELGRASAAAYILLAILAFGFFVRSEDATRRIGSIGNRRALATRRRHLFGQCRPDGSLKARP